MEAFIFTFFGFMAFQMHLYGLAATENIIHGGVSNESNDLKNYASNVTEQCTLELKRNSIQRFKHIAYYGDLGLVFLYLNVTSGLALHSGTYVVGEDMWIWTYYGKKGGLKFLSWPLEYGIWSMGILNTFVGGPADIEIFNKSGDCSNLTVGDYKTDIAITTALTNLSDVMIALDGNDKRYGSSFWCYKRRAYIRPAFVFFLCKHIMCPVEALEYVCRSYFYNSDKQHRELSRHPFVFKYDRLWWVFPFIVAVLLFSFSPLLLLTLGNKVEKWLHKWKTYPDYTSSAKYIFMDGTNYITLSNTLFGPFCMYCHKKDLVLARFIRLLLPFISLSIVALQIFLDYRYLYDYVILSTDKFVPMGFRSMLAGYESSSKNFLPLLGGPFIACFIYLFVTSILIIFPRSLSKTLELGLTNKDISEGISSLSLSENVLERYGSVLITKKHGYERVLSVLLANFYLLINIEFWKLLFRIQQNRWIGFKSSILRKILFPLYVIFCAGEATLCILKYGSPIINFTVIIYRGYSSVLYHSLAKRTWKIFLVFAVAILILSLMIFVFMFCTIFLDACLFLSRLIVFTYTGIVVYPKVSYGYIIFSATIIYYLWECIQNFSSHYTNLLRTTVSVCESIQRANDTEPLVIRKAHCKGIEARLFYDVIELYSPKRKKVFISVMQMSAIVCILGMSVHLLMQTNKFQDLHTIMHVGTTLFICAFPKIIRSMCCSQKSRIVQRRQRAEIKVVVRRCLDFFSDDESFDDDMLESE